LLQFFLNFRCRRKLSSISRVTQVFADHFFSLHMWTRWWKSKSCNECI